MCCVRVSTLEAFAELNYLEVRWRGREETLSTTVDPAIAYPVPGKGCTCEDTLSLLWGKFNMSSWSCLIKIIPDINLN